MSQLWPVVTVDNPCPICGKPDWCALGDIKVKCMRITSEHPAADGGFYHDYPGKSAGTKSSQMWRPLPKRAPARAIDAATIMLQLLTKNDNARLARLAAELCVSFASLQMLGVAWFELHEAFAFPMTDGDGKIVGIRLRNDDGKKWAVTGSHQGLFEPMHWDAPNEIAIAHNKFAMVCEGPTDTAAALTLGFSAIGRPSCNAGQEHIKTALQRRAVRRVVIVCDDDTRQKPDGTQYSPGINGARALAKFLRMPYVILPPCGCKDLREYVRKGGNASNLNAMLNNMRWLR